MQDKAQFLESLESFHKWCKEHSPEEIASEVAQMTPEDRVRFRAHMSVMRDWLKEARDTLDKLGTKPIKPVRPFSRERSATWGKPRTKEEMLRILGIRENDAKKRKKPRKQG